MHSSEDSDGSTALDPLGPAARGSRRDRGLRDFDLNAPANTAAPTTATFPSATAHLVLLTEEYAPLNYHEDGRPAGIAIDLLNETLHRLRNGQSIDEAQFLPWAVAYNRTLVETDTVLFGTSRLASRENLFKWAGPIYPERAVLFGLRERNITIASASELPGYRIGVVQDDAAVQKLRDLGVPESSLRVRRIRRTLRGGSTRGMSTSSSTGSSPDAGLPGTRA